MLHKFNIRKILLTLRKTTHFPPAVNDKKTTFAIGISTSVILSEI